MVKPLNTKIQLLIDIIAFFLAWILCYALRFYVANGQPGMEFYFIVLALIQSGITVWFFARLNHYTSSRFSPIEIVLGTVKANMKAIFVLVVLLYFFYPDKISRGFLILYAAISTTFFIFEKLTLRIYFLKSKQKKDEILLVGDSPLLSKLVSRFTNEHHDPFKYIHFIGWYHPPKDNATFNIPEWSDSVLNENLKSHTLDGIYVSFSEINKHKESLFLKEHLLDPTPIRILIETTPLLLGHSVRSRDGLLSIDLNQTQHPQHLLFLKRVFDIVGSAVGIIILSPLLLLLCALIKLTSRGAIFYSQDRVGLNGKVFKMWKFRSMLPAKNSEDLTEWANKNNNRRTRFGDFLRKSSLDELPQLFNVLVGNMSLIGPRPERPFFVDKFKDEIPGYMLRHSMPVGLSGWAQINGLRGDTSIKDRIEHDIYYIQHWSLWLDIQIVFLTMWKSLIDKNV